MLDEKSPKLYLGSFPKTDSTKIHFKFFLKSLDLSSIRLALYGFKVLSASLSLLVQCNEMVEQITIGYT